MASKIEVVLPNAEKLNLQVIGRTGIGVRAALGSAVWTNSVRRNATSDGAECRAVAFIVRTLMGYDAGGMIEYTAFRSARSRGSPVIVAPIWLVTYP